MHEPMRSPCARLVLLMHSLERADNWRSIIGSYTQQRSVCSVLIIWNNVNASMPEVLRSALSDKTRVIAARQNSLTNRYTLLPSGTDPVLFADDDLILDASLVQRISSWPSPSSSSASSRGGPTRRPTARRSLFP